MSAQIKDGGPAFPIPLNHGEGFTVMGPADGMSLREYFAAKAMQGMCADRFVRYKDEIAKLAYDVADEMLAARDRGAA